MTSTWSIEYRDNNAANFKDCIVFEEFEPMESGQQLIIPRTEFLKLMETL